VRTFIAVCDIFGGHSDVPVAYFAENHLKFRLEMYGNFWGQL
jgi:hypothetical protein